MAGSDLITATNEGADLTIARARLGLGLIAPLSIYVDPANNGWFDITSYSLAVLLAYLAYALSAYLVVRKKPVLVRSIRYLSITAFLDVLFAAAVALVTEGPTSPSWLFFVFAILAVNLRTRFHAGVFITLCSSGIYLALLRIAAPGRQFEMRAAYLAIVGYLIRFFGHEHSELEKAVRELETEQQRHQIARALHDGYIQALATVNLQLDTCRKLLKSQRLEDATLMVEDIQTGVKREYDEVRAFVRSLANRGGPGYSGSGHVSETDTCFDISVSFKARGLVPEQIFQIMIEAMRNTRDHASAHHSRISALEQDDHISIAIEDDGIGLDELEDKPWTIASRVAEYGGLLQIDGSGNSARGTHIRIQLPKNEP